MTEFYKLTSVIFYDFYNSLLVFLRNVCQYKFQVHIKKYKKHKALIEPQF